MENDGIVESNHMVYLKKELPTLKKNLKTWMT